MPDESAAPSPDERQELLSGLPRQMAEAQQLRKEGKLAEAVAAAKRVLELERRLFGDVHPAVVDTLLWLAQTQAAQERFSEAKSACGQAAQIASRLYGPDHWRAVDARQTQAYVAKLESLGPDQRAELAAAEGRIGEAGELGRQNRPQEALRLAEPAVDALKRLLGEKDLRYAAGLDLLAAIRQSLYDHRQAEQLYRQSLAIREAALGREHPKYLATLNALGLLYYAAGDYAQAEPALKQALEVSGKVFGAEHPDSITCLSNLAELYQAQGAYGQAEPLLREALERSKQSRGESHPEYATALNNLAGLYQSMGDCARAEPLLLEAMEIRKRAFGENSPEYAASLNNLAGLYYQMGDYTRAEPLLEKTLEVRKESLGQKHPDYAATLSNLAAVYESLGQPERAEPLYRQALEVRRQVLGVKHPDYAASLNNLAALYRSRGDYVRAEPLSREALDTRREVLGPRHPDYAASLNNLAVLCRSKGDFARAEPLYREALDIQRALLVETFAVLSQRQQLAMTRELRRTLDGYLSVTSRLESQGDRSYQYVLAWKGMVFVHQRQARLAAARPELTPLLEQLRSASSGLAALVFSRPDPSRRAAYAQRIRELSAEKERLEAELARRGAASGASGTQVAPERLRAGLPAGVVLVDFMEYANSVADPVFAPHFAAFVVRPDRPVVRIELGPAAPIREAIEVWRRTFGQAGQGADAAADLRRRVWTPIAEHVAGSRITLVSPDGDLARFPLAALPGREPGTYLLEEMPLAVLPVPQWLPEMLARPAGESPQTEAAEPSLLLLGDIDYDASPAAAREATPDDQAARGLVATRPESLRFAPLDSSRGEILAVRDSFELAWPEGRVRLLRRNQATEAAFRQHAPGCRFLHLATHGFFAPPEWSSLTAPADGDGRGRTHQGENPWPGRDLAAMHPGLLCGLALAGANLPPQPGADDGILTAEEVAALDLHGVDLAVLSACETGLGAAAGGEGVLGLQRAFQVSGARTVVASLWKVADEPTRQLMERFYENLWGKKMGKLEALREAQLAMLRQGAERGMVIVSKDGQAPKPRGLPPYAWAAFVVSGDWR